MKKPEIFTSWLFTEKFTNHYFRANFKAIKKVTLNIPLHIIPNEEKSEDLAFLLCPPKQTNLIGIY